MHNRRGRGWSLGLARIVLLMSAPTSTEVLDLTSSSHTRSKFFVFVRYWPGFTDQFPYVSFAGLHASQIEPVIRKILATELWSHRSELRRARKKTLARKE